MPSTIARGLFWVTSILVALVSFRILALGIETGFPAMLHQLANASAFWAHVLGGSTALLLMPFQFWTRLRTTRPVLHRWIGRAYVLAILIGGAAGLRIALDAQGGLAGRIGFATLAVLWIVATTLAFLKARARDFAAHRRWMIRSAAMTFAAVTLRILLPLSMAAQIPFEVAYPIIAWACWVPNLIAVELWRLSRQPVSAALKA